ncbi:MAG: hypothetical protein K2X70_00945, partial [Candidatus Obscuribacterales bacterium]|nr:hypothetical protein [Candidatus Obscuribacterales bacterium]
YETSEAIFCRVKIVSRRWMSVLMLVFALIAALAHGLGVLDGAAFFDGLMQVCMCQFCIKCQLLKTPRSPSQL